ncbi:MAG: hypothetical protein ABSG55_01565 [Dehalococcoidia bacterium]|jgi:hypothetical protein
MLFWFLEGVSAPTVGTIVAVLTIRRTDDSVLRATVPTFSAVTWLIVTLFALLAANLLIAPYRQRNEARRINVLRESDEVAVVIAKVKAKGLLQPFSYWSDRWGLGTSVRESGFNREEFGHLAKLGLVEPQVSPGNAYPPTSPLYSAPKTLYFLTPLARAVLSRLEDSAPGESPIQAGSRPNVG